MRFPRFARFLTALALGLATLAPAGAEPLAKTLFGGKDLPSAGAPQSHGFYSKGCFGGGVGVAPDGPHWQVMRLSRNRRWGHPAMISLLERLSERAHADGWNGLLIGDVSQPRGGPMVTGHASHQLGLDADIWFQPMPAQRLSAGQRENVGAQSLLKKGTLTVDERKWTRAHEAVLRDAAQFPEVERIFVHPGVKKKLCDTVAGDRAWLHKIRPFWGHDDHFHVRISCPPGSSGCRRQHAQPAGTGCDASLAWWFTEEPWKPSPGPAKPKARDVMTMASLPNACRAVLAAAPVSSARAATVGGDGGASALAYGTIDPARVLRAMDAARVPRPMPRPAMQ